MKVYRGVNKLGPNSSELSKGFINYPPASAPKGNLYDWFLLQMNPGDWEMGQAYKYGDKVTYDDQQFKAKRNVNPPKEIPGGDRPLPNVPPVGASKDWELIVNPAKDVNALGQSWRASTPGGLIATAVSEEGAFDTMEYVYEIEYKDDEVYCFSLNKDGSVQGAAFHPNFIEMQKRQDKYKQYLLVTNVSTAADLKTASLNMLALYHGVVQTQEVTFMSPIPRDKMAGWRQGGVNLRGQYTKI